MDAISGCVTYIITLIGKGIIFLFVIAALLKGFGILQFLYELVILRHHVVLSGDDIGWIVIWIGIILWIFTKKR